MENYMNIIQHECEDFPHPKIDNAQEWTEEHIEAIASRLLSFTTTLDEIDLPLAGLVGLREALHELGRWHK
jgi:hypothetical protein